MRSDRAAPPRGDGNTLEPPEVQGIAYSRWDGSTAMNGSGGASSSTGAKNTGAPSGTTTGSANSSSYNADRWYPDHAVLNTTKDQLKAMPEFKYN